MILVSILSLRRSLHHQSQHCVTKVRGGLNLLTPRAPAMRLPTVCPWGGSYTSNCGNMDIKLTNTFPIDNSLTLFSINIKNNCSLQRQVQQIQKPYSINLLEATQLYNEGKFAESKLRWLQQLPQFDITVSGTLNVWGERIVCKLSLRSIHTAVTSTCLTPHCPKEVGTG